MGICISRGFCIQNFGKKLDCKIKRNSVVSVGTKSEVILWVNLKSTREFSINNPDNPNRKALVWIIVHRKWKLWQRLLISSQTLILKNNAISKQLFRPAMHSLQKNYQTNLKNPEYGTRLKILRWSWRKPLLVIYCLVNFRMELIWATILCWRC